MNLIVLLVVWGAGMVTLLCWLSRPFWPVWVYVFIVLVPCKRLSILRFDARPDS